jgi:protease-4
MKRFVLLLSLIFVTSGLYAQGLVLPSTSDAVTDNVLSTVSNPAWLGYRHGGEMLFAFPYTDSTSSEDLGVLLKFGSFGFAGEFADNEAQNFNKYTIAHGSKLGSGFYFGTSFSWYRVVDWEGSWNFGLGYRPLPFLSAGLVARDINQPNRNGVELEPSYSLALALRPFGDRWTVSGDVLFTKDATHNYGDELDPLIRIEGLPWDGIRLVGEYRIDSEAYGIGLSLALDNMTLGHFSNIDDAGDHANSVGYFHFTSGKHKSVLLKKTNQIVEMKIGGEVHEARPGFCFFCPRGKTLQQIRQEIIHYADDPNVEGLLIRFENPRIGFAQAQQIRRTLEEFKLTGKRLIAYCDDYSQVEYFIATVCDEINVLPVGMVDLKGLAAVMGYWKGTLDKLGIGVQFVSVRDYKTAANMLLYEDATEAEAEMINWLLDDLYDKICTKIAEGRGWNLDEVKQKIDSGAYYSANALEAGLVDSLVYYDQITKRLRDRNYNLIPEKTYWRFPEYRENWPDTRIPKVAVIYCEGSIFSGESQRDMFGGAQTMGSETIAKLIRGAREDKTIDAIIMRINSPGGSALASEAIYREVRNTVTDEENRKPIIVSMGNVAGSGGYHIACAADTIIAEESTITGSIGVLAGKFNLEGLHKKIYYNTHTFKRGEHADVWRANRPFNEEELAMLQDAVDQVYDDFVAKVAMSRPLTEEEVNTIGEGRVWTGSQAAENGLVDLIGGMDVAFEIVRAKLGVPAGSALQLEALPKPKGLFRTTLDEVLTFRTDVIPEELHEALEPLTLLAEFYNGEPMMLMPYKIEVE